MTADLRRAIRKLWRSERAPNLVVWIQETAQSTRFDSGRSSSTQAHAPRMTSVAPPSPRTTGNLVPTDRYVNRGPSARAYSESNTSARPEIRPLICHVF